MLRDLYPVADEIEEAMIEYDLPHEMLDLIISFYGLSETPFKPKCFDRLVELLKEKFDYSLMNTNIACMYGTLLCVMYDNPSAQIYHLAELVDIYRSVGFRSRVSNMMAFGFLDEQDDCEERAVKALKLYHAMHDRHGIITGEDDYLATMYLAGLDMEIQETIDAIEQTYRHLAVGGFSKGNALQSLSHQLLLSESRQRAADLSVHWYKQFKKAGIKTNASQIACYGLLAELNLDTDFYMSTLTTKINEAKLLEGGRRLKTLDKTIIILEAIKTVYHETKQENLAFSKAYIRACMLLLLTGYLFRERLI